MTRPAVIDVGTNSVRLLIADVDGERFVPVWRDLAMPRLGRGVDQHRRLSEEAMHATIAAIRGLAARAQEHRATSITVVGTSALRDAVNRDEFIARVRHETGLNVTVLSGREEASLSFFGAVRRLAATPADSSRKSGVLDGQTQEVFVLDVGGGSTELIRGWTDGVMDSVLSVDVGSVRMTESCVRSDPISDADWSRLVAAVRDKLRPLWEELSVGLTASASSATPGDSDVAVDARRFIGLGGTATTLAAIHQELHEYDPARVHGYTLSKEQVANIIDKLRAAPVAERRTWPGVQSERADIILAGAVIVYEVMSGVGASRMTVSESDLLEGVLLQDTGFGTAFPLRPRDARR